MTATTELATSGPPRRRPRRLRRWLLGLVGAALVLVVLLPLGTAGYVYVVARQDDRTASDVVVVLGAAQYWNRPSPVLAARLRHAQALYQAGVGEQILTVGGKQPGDNTTEAQAGRRWLTDHGVPADRVSAVPTGHDTLSSLSAVARLMHERGWTSAVLVTDPAHEARSAAIARALGISVRTSPTQDGAGSSVTLDYVARETLGLLAFWLTERSDVAQVVGTGPAREET